jgi:Ca2+:H+ antiporter
MATHGIEVRGLLRNPLYWLLLAFPLAIVLFSAGAGAIWTFAAAAVAVVPLAALLGIATEALAATLGPVWSGFLNATFGNAAELIIGLVALRKGPQMYPLIKASITGSIMGNFLLVTGASLLAGGMRYPTQRFQPVSVSMGSTLLALASMGLLLPTVYYHLAGPSTAADHLSEEIAFVLLGAYLLSLLFSLKTHRNLFAGTDRAKEESASHGPGRGVALGVLVGATAAIAVASEILADSVEAAAHTLGMNRIFVGAIVLAIVGNAAEHSTAVMMALKNRTELSLQISIGSATQIALFVAPVFVFASMLLGGPTFDLHFTPLEVIAVLASVFVVDLVARDGETNWLEGAMLLAVYAIFALAFFHFPYPS